jgi:3-keto-L-gulonate-6-phosphate decarboxylase
MEAMQKKIDVTNLFGDRNFILAVGTCLIRKCGRFEVIRDFRSLKNGEIPFPVDGSIAEQT